MITSLDTAGALTRTDYQPFGENPSLAGGSFQYTAARFDPETAGSVSQPSGLYYMRSRMYCPSWGRFCQPDTIGYAGGNNLYAYVGNDPLNGTDPSGTCYPWCTAAIGAVVGAGAAILSDPHGWNWKTVTAGAVIGASIGAGAPILSSALEGVAGSGVAVNIGANFLTGSLTSAASDVLNGNPLNGVKDVELGAISTVGGMLSGETLAASYTAAMLGVSQTAVDLFGDALSVGSTILSAVGGYLLGPSTAQGEPPPASPAGSAAPPIGTAPAGGGDGGRT